jgi:hypothetical protein
VELLYHGQREYVWGRVLGRSIAGSVPVFVKDSVKKISEKMTECFGVVRMSDRGGEVVVEEEVIEDDFSSRPWWENWEYRFEEYIFETESGRISSRIPPSNYALNLKQEGGKLKVEIRRMWGEAATGALAFLMKFKRPFRIQDFDFEMRMEIEEKRNLEAFGFGSFVIRGDESIDITNILKDVNGILGCGDVESSSFGYGWLCLLKGGEIKWKWGGGSFPVPLTLSIKKSYRSGTAILRGEVLMRVGGYPDDLTFFSDEVTFYPADGTHVYGVGVGMKEIGGWVGSAAVLRFSFDRFTSSLRVIKVKEVFPYEGIEYMGWRFNDKLGGGEGKANYWVIKGLEGGRS